MQLEKTVWQCIHLHKRRREKAAWSDRKKRHANFDKWTRLKRQFHEKRKVHKIK
jgi:hypothetical protein